MAGTTGRRLFSCKQPVNFTYEGNPVFLSKGAVVREGHPLLKGHEELFEPLVVHYEVDEPVEAEEDTPSRSGTRPPKDDAPRSAVRADQREARTR